MCEMSFTPSAAILSTLHLLLYVFDMNTYMNHCKHTDMNLYRFLHFGYFTVSPCCQWNAEVFITPHLLVDVWGQTEEQ